MQDDDLPDQFVVFNAGESDQTAGVIDEVRHGRFSYFLFKGLEGAADANRDSQISNEELYSYIREQVMRFSAGSQTPDIMGKKSGWVVN